MRYHSLLLLSVLCTVFSLQACGQGGQGGRRHPPEAKEKNTGGSHHRRSAKKADTLAGRAVRIKDGDTFVLLTDSSEQVDIRLGGIDAPEKKQDFGNRAKDALGALLMDHRITVISQTRDRYGRTVGDVYTEPHSWVNLSMVQQGMAWLYTEYSDDAQLKAAEDAARSAHAGLWAMDNAKAPWLFRADKRKVKK